MLSRDLMHHIEQGGCTDEQIVNMFLSVCTHSRYTLRNYKRAIDHFRRFVLPKSLHEVTWRDIEAYKIGLTRGVNSVSQTPLAPASVASLLAPLRSLYKWGSDPNVKLFTHNPTTCVRSPRIYVTSKNHYLTRREVVLFLKQLKAQGERDYLIGLTLIMLGLRVSELTSIQWGHFHTDPAETSIWLTVAQGKGGKEREVKVPPKFWELFKEFSQTLGAVQDQRVFPVSVRQVERIIRKARDNCHLGKKITPHWLRHTNATLALLHGASLQQVQANLGHAHLTTTQRYLHTVEQMQKAAPDYVESCLHEAIHM
ncbi:tyrosine-type recombinase/integrase [Brevibacillus sp. B_LB10_24]|uniref:tyrosine-type recombinase/integrase n=1 Tax=Brevibacillus sp. B_LB10_24 TaxID=3380645 RepID=UPI0038BC4943